MLNAMKYMDLTSPTKKLIQKRNKAETQKSNILSCALGQGTTPSPKGAQLNAVMKYQDDKISQFVTFRFIAANEVT